MWQANWLFSGIKGDGMKKTVKNSGKKDMQYGFLYFWFLYFIFPGRWRHRSMPHRMKVCATRSSNLL